MFGLGKKKVDTEALGKECADKIPGDANYREVTHHLVAIEQAARKSGFSQQTAGEITGAVFRAYLAKTGQAHLYPEIF
jgi:hypothetical protein